MLAWVPMASMVTMQPSSARTDSSCGIAVFSLDFSAVACWPSTSPTPAAKALTSCRGRHRLYTCAPTGLAVNGDNLGAEGWEQRTDPSPKGGFEFLRADQAEQPAKS